MQYRLRTLLTVMAIAPIVLAGCYFAMREMSAPTWAIILGGSQIVFWLALLSLAVRRIVTPPPR